MKRYNFAVIILACLFGNDPCSAGEFNPVLNIGDAAPAWEDLPGTDDAKHSLADLADSKAVVVAFTCNSCPYAADVEQRLISLDKDYRELSVSVIAINVNKIDEDRMPAMKEQAEKVGFRFPYLFDETQQIAKAFGANYTPEFFVLDSERRIVYMGSFDDSPDGTKVTKQYVRKAIDAAITDQEPASTETVPIGCKIRFERVRRTRKKAKTE